jgi:hypothetical protein
MARCTLMSRLPVIGGRAHRVQRVTGVIVAAIALGPATQARAATPAPAWTITSTSEPTNFVPGDSSGRDAYNVVATNTGAAPTDGSTITLTDSLPSGVTLDPAGVFAQDATLDEVSCSGSTTILCTAPGPLSPGETMYLRIPVDVSEGAQAPATNAATVTGGGAAPASASEPTAITTTPAAPGFQSFESILTNREGGSASQAGSHPFSFTSSFSLDTRTDAAGNIIPGGNVKDVEAELPRGMIGYPNAVPFCSLQAFYTTEGTDCPSDAAVGIARLVIRGSARSGPPAVDWEPIWNLQPPANVPAEFGVRPAGAFSNLGVVMQAKLRTGGDYGITVDTPNITEEDSLYAASLTFWGVPAEPSHDVLRGHCLQEGQDGGGSSGACPAGVPAKPLLALPTSCTGPLAATIRMDSWEEPGVWSVDSAVAGSPGGLRGCEALAFDPSVTVQPASSVASSPSGLNVDVRIPQNESPGGLADANLKRAVVTLPAGMALSPSAAVGLGACTPEEIGLNNANVPSCPESAKVGTAEATSPSLQYPLTGDVYVAQQENNPFGSLFALYVVLEGSGVLVKEAGEARLDPITGQVTATFDNLPQQAVSDIKLQLFGGAKATVATPPSCGTYTTTSQLTPYSSPSLASLTWPFAITSMPDNTACAPTSPFAPSLNAGTTNNQGGAFSPLLATFSRQDHEQDIAGVRLKMPPGLLGKLATVALCGEPQAGQGTCGPASQIGHVTVAAGVGPAPAYVTGRVFLTGRYRDAPFGLSIVIPAAVGPFNLGTVVVRAAVYVDPQTAQITALSDPLPTILQGVPLQIKTMSVDIDRPGFIFNPTNCSSSSMSGSATSTQGVTAALSSRFQAANCATLAFKPRLAASTAGRASKAAGASLDVKVASKGGPQPGGGEANIKSVKVDLPKQLPSRLTTLQKACVASVFEANPAGCPQESNVGSATAVTPVLAHPLSGPAYLVSHGGAAFPDLEIVLQGEGIVLILDGKTDIKHGVTSSTFNTVPDAPISSFELKLPTGRFSILGAYLPHSPGYSFCGQKLSMPTMITGQNGAVIKQSTKIAVTGCPKAKHARKAGRARKASHRQLRDRSS